MKIKIIYFKKLYFKNIFNIFINILNQYSITLISGGNSIKKNYSKLKNKNFNNIIFILDKNAYQKIKNIKNIEQINS